MIPSPMVRTGLALALAAATALAGCASTPPSRPSGRTTTCDAAALQGAVLSGNGALMPQLPGTFTPIPLSQVQFLDPSMSNRLMVQTVGSARTPTNTVEVMARVVNCLDVAVQVEGRTHFLAESQAPTEPVSAWKRIYIPPRSMGVYTEKSVAAGTVANYLIEMRPGT